MNAWVITHYSHGEELWRSTEMASGGLVDALVSQVEAKHRSSANTTETQSWIKICNSSL